MKRLFARTIGAYADIACLIFLLALFVAVFPSSAGAQITIAQISDTHLGESHAPHAAENVRRVVEMVNSRHPDAVILSGDIGENPEEWQRARGILKGLRAPLYYAPGNHDVHSNDVQRYRDVFGPDYYRFQVKGVTFIVIDSQLLGNYDDFNAQSRSKLKPKDRRCSPGWPSKARAETIVEKIGTRTTIGTRTIVATRIMTVTPTTVMTRIATGIGMIGAEKLSSEFNTSRCFAATIFPAIPNPIGPSMIPIARVSWTCCTNWVFATCS
jgi:3',5'-cyclic AMP phosphodiesterase CpdA